MRFEPWASAEPGRVHLVEHPSSGEPLVAGEPPRRVRFDKTDVYRLLYLTLFRQQLPSRLGLETVTRHDG